MKKQFEITKQDFEITKTYPAFKIGTDTDSDVLARMAGIGEGEEMAVHKVWFERKGVSYLYKISYRSTGEQRHMNITEGMDENKRNRLDSLINDEQLRNEEDIKAVAKLIKKGHIEFGNNSWYEGDITITIGERVILRGFESELGLDGVHDSIKGIKDSSEDIKTTIEYLMEEHWEDPSNAEQFIEGLKE